MTKLTQSPPPDASSEHRLPYTVEPHRYDLRIAPDIDAATFEGEVRITSTAHAAISEVALNSAELTILSASVRTEDGRVLDAKVELDTEHERLILNLPEDLPPGAVDIEIAFAGILNDQLHGFYRSTFTDTNGVTQTLAATQFEATDARRAFPCFDEPDRKAVFAVTLDVPPGLFAYSNGPEVEKRMLDDGSVRVRFAPTIPMSSYLVAFVVGPLVATEPTDVDGVPVRIVHAPGKENFCDFALEAAAHALRFFTQWFGIAYPAEKLDLLAIPDFAFGAMENLGCVTFREVLLLIDPERASRMELERIADVISHEIAHMWFGDLVTMKWWNGIWLNEAFATFMEVTCVDDFRPQWKRWTSFGMERAAAMATDALHTTRPVEYPVGRPEEAQGMFDVLTYQKGASVLKMLEQYLGEDRFRDGVRHYLTEHRLSNTETTDLWDAIEAASGEPVREIMDSWIFQGGFPLVAVEPPAGGNPGVVIRQTPFAYAPAPASGKSAIGSDWLVPVVARDVVGSDGAETRVLLQSASAGVDVRGSQTPLILINARGHGYYRVRYEPSHLQRLAESMGSLDPLEKSNLLGDTWAAVVSGRSELGDFCVLAEALGDETDPDVWAQVAAALGFLEHAVDDRTLPQLAAYTRALVSPVFERVGWERTSKEDERTSSLRAQLIATLGIVGEDPAVRAECERLQSVELSGSQRIDPNLASVVAGVVASFGTSPEYERFLERYRHAETPQEEVRYRSALAAFRDPELARRTFDLAMTEVRSQDTPFLVNLLLSSRENGALAWQLVKDNWDPLVARIPSQSVSRMLEGVKLLCRDATLASDVRGFVAEHPVEVGQRTVDQALERLEINVSFASRLSESAGAPLAAGVSRLAPD